MTVLEKMNNLLADKSIDKRKRELCRLSFELLPKDATSQKALQQDNWEVWISSLKTDTSCSPEQINQPDLDFEKIGKLATQIRYRARNILAFLGNIDENRLLIG